DPAPAATPALFVRRFFSGADAGEKFHPAKRQSPNDSTPPPATLELQLHRVAVLLVRARSVERYARIGVTRRDQVLFDQVTLHFFAAHVGQHFPIDLDAGR